MNTKLWRLKVCLAIKDKNHLEKFCAFINSNPPKEIKSANGHGAVEIQIQDKKFLPDFSKKFGMVARKTFCYKNKPIENDALFMSFFAGFIDGNGSVKKLHDRQDAHISLVGHGGVIEYHRELAARIYKIFPPTKTHDRISEGTLPYIDKRGYTRWSISNTEVVAEIKKFIEQLDLPLLERKWANIDLSRPQRHLEAKKRRETARVLSAQGKSRSEIAIILGVSRSATFRYFK
jgi:hypothetical protein